MRQPGDSHSRDLAKWDHQNIKTSSVDARTHPRLRSTHTSSPMFSIAEAINHSVAESTQRGKGRNRRKGQKGSFS